MATIYSVTQPAAAPVATHQKLQQALDRVAQGNVATPCAEPAPPELLKGIAELNAGEFFEQHETLELLWRATPGEVRHLYEGILQVGVGMHHLFANHNFHGAAVKLDHGIRLLEAFPPVCHGVDVARFRTDARKAWQHLADLGPERLGEFDRGFVPRVHMVAEESNGDRHG